MKKTLIAISILASVSAVAAPSDQAFGKLVTRVDGHDQEINDMGMELGKVRTAANQNSSKIIDLTKRVDQNEQGLHNAVQHIGSNTQEIASLKNAQSQISASVLNNANDIASVKAVADKAAADNTRQDGQIRNIQTIVQNENNARKAEIAANTAKIDSNKADADKQIGDLQTHVDNGLVTLNTKVNTAQAAADKNTQAVTALGGRVTAVETKVDGVQSATVSLNKDLNAARADIATNTKAITDTQVKVTSNEQAIAKVQQQAQLNASDLGKEASTRQAEDAKLQTGLTSLTTKVDANKQNIDQTSHKVDEVIRLNSKLTLASASHESRLNTVEGAVTTTNAKVDANTQSINHVNQRVDQTDQDVSNMRHDVDTNTANINALEQWQKQANANLVGATNTNSKRLDKVEKDVSKLKKDMVDTKDQVKRVGALGMAASNLHYAGLDSGYAIAVGQYSDKTALAGGLQFNMTANSAATVQVAYDGEDFGGSVGVHGRW